MTQPSLGELYTSACEGDRASAEALVTSLTKMVVSTARNAGIPSGSVEDVASTAWLKLFDACGKLNEPEAVAGWLRTTTYNQAMQWHRGKTREPRPASGQLPDPPEVDPGFELVEEDSINAERRVIVGQALPRLDARCREMIDMKTRVPRLTNREIAERLGMPIGSIAPTHGRCLDKLRAIVREVNHELGKSSSW